MTQIEFYNKEVDSEKRVLVTLVESERSNAMEGSRVILSRSERISICSYYIYEHDTECEWDSDSFKSCVVPWSWVSQVKRFNRAQAHGYAASTALRNCPIYWIFRL